MVSSDIFPLLLVTLGHSIRSNNRTQFRRSNCSQKAREHSRENVKSVKKKLKTGFYGLFSIENPS